VKNVLIVNTVGLLYDGINSVMLSNLEAMDKEGLKIYVASTVREDSAVRRKYKSLGCRIIRFPDRKKHPVRYFFALSAAIRKLHIEVVHANGNSGTLAVEMLAAKLSGCRKRIAHSHNTRCDQVRADRLLRPLFDRTYTDAVACGKEAGRWLFDDRPFMVIQNGRNLSSYAYDGGRREKMRRKLGLGDQLAIGHVGGFVPQKNHRFLIKIYKAIAKRRSDVKFFCAGDGALRKEIEKEAEGLDITFTGNINDIPDFLLAMDGMLLPSLFEGLPLVAVEWQASGLPAILADTISEDAVFTDFVKRMKLEDDAGKWADAILSMIDKDKRQEQALLGAEQAKVKGFDIRDSAGALRGLYLGENI